MNVFVGGMDAECNEHVSEIIGLDGLHLLRGEECAEALNVRETFEAAGIRVIGGLYAHAGPTGMLSREAFEAVSSELLRRVKEHLHEIDAVYLKLHGASGVDGLDEVSGEHVLIDRLRSLVGRHMPIAVVQDPHGNITRAFAESVNIVRCYRESPHTDTVATGQIVARTLSDLMLHRRPMRPIVFKLPMLLGGEQSLSAEEPMRTVNRMLDEAEKDPRMFSCCFYVGYLSHDDDKLGAAVVVVPDRPEDEAFCRARGERIARAVWDLRGEFGFKGNFAPPEEAVVRTLAEGKRSAVITDLGDNCGAGAMGQQTELLRCMLKHWQGEKKVLFAGIRDVRAHAQLLGLPVGAEVSFDLGAGEDERSAPVHIEGTVVASGDEYKGYGNAVFMGRKVGEAVTVRVKGTLIDVLVLDTNLQYGHPYEFQRAGLDFHAYDVVVVKMGYLDTYLIPETRYHCMAVTDGPTAQEPQKFDFKRVYRPIWPLDEVKELRFIE